jgi:hypothetical protein
MLFDVRTTLDIDNELLLAVKAIAQQRKTTAGQVVSSLLRESLAPKDFKVEHRNGVPLLPKRPSGPRVTSEMVSRLLDEED